MTGTLINRQNLLLGTNSGTRTLHADVRGVILAGKNTGTQTIGEFARGGMISGYNDLGTQEVFGYGSMIRGSANLGDTQTVSGAGSMLLIDGGSATISGAESLGLGAVTITHAQALVVGDGGVSPGIRTITAVGGFYGDGAGLTNIAYIRGTAITNTAAAPTDNYILKYDAALGLWNYEEDTGGGGGGDFMADGSVPMTGNLNMGGYSITNQGPSDPYIVPYQITPAATVTITRAMTDLMRLDMNTTVTLTMDADMIATNGSYYATLELYKGTNTLGWDTAVFTNTTLLDISSATKTYKLSLGKAQKETRVEVRQ